MASPATIDFDTLLAPIPGGEPAGVELKENEALSKFFYLVRDARTAAREAEKLAAQEEGGIRNLDVRPWNKVYDLAVDILATKSKDLWVAAWLIEALCRRNQFAGLRDGFRLVRELAEQYWEGIHPRPDEDGVSTTVAQIAGLNGQDADGTLLAPIDFLPIAQDTDGSGLTSADYIVAYEADERKIRKSNRAELIGRFEQAARSTPRAFFDNLREDLAGAIEEYEKLIVLLDEKCSASGEMVPSSKIMSALRSAAERAQRLAGDAPPSASTGGDQGASAGGASSNTSAHASGGGIAVGGKIGTREDAFRLLLQVADFFRRTEPHSPVSYTLEQAVRWGRMSLPELLQEIVNNSDTRSDLFRLTGIPEPKRDD